MIAPRKNSCNDQENVEPNVQQRNNLVSAEQLKKKEVQPKSSKRKKSWIDKLQKRKPKPAKSTKQTKKSSKGICSIEPAHSYMLLSFIHKIINLTCIARSKRKMMVYIPK